MNKDQIIMALGITSFMVLLWGISWRIIAKSWRGQFYQSQEILNGWKAHAQQCQKDYADLVNQRTQTPPQDRP